MAGLLIFFNFSHNKITLHLFPLLVEVDLLVPHLVVASCCVLSSLSLEVGLGWDLSGC